MGVIVRDFEWYENTDEKWPEVWSFYDKAYLPSSVIVFCKTSLNYAYPATEHGTAVVAMDDDCIVLF